MPIRRPVLLLYIAALGGLVGATALIELAPWHWAGELLANLRLHLAVAGLGLAVAGLLLAIRWRLRLMLLLVGAGLAALHVRPLWPYIALPPPPAQVQPSGKPLRLMIANLRTWAVDLAALQKLLREGGADIVLLTELTPTQQPTYEASRDLYPYQFQPPYQADNSFAVRVMARQPMELTVFHPVPADFPVLQARFCLAQQRCLTVLTVHAARPGPKGRDLRNTLLRTVAEQAKAAAARGDHVIAAGDFNITAFSPDFGLFQEAGLSDSALGRGYPSTWPNFLPGIGLGIDHVLVSADIAVLRRWIGPDIKSDHYPLFVELNLP